jgi:hypothetical protein
MKWETLQLFFMIVSFLCVGIIAMGWARNIQQMHLQWLSKNNLHKGWVEGDIYVSLIRFLGIFFLVMSVSMIVVRLAFPWMPLSVK